MRHKILVLVALMIAAAMLCTFFVLAMILSQAAL